MANKRFILLALILTVAIGAYVGLYFLPEPECVPDKTWCR